ncbi:VOC family protein [Brevibacillus brevis]|uniref:VOC family protein n=1 Tax=Brevibacillus brevis TaxID=1393 RepID=A0ABY9T8V1_BREBE|nr:VOC family protein [Brevibacillus brevis]WNC16309.1 VOC family protein [Brevibacillus brevis]
MKLSHLNLCVNDVSEAIAFFQHVFDFQLFDQKGDFIAGMGDGHGFSLVLSKLRSDESVSYPTDFHLGFYVETMTEVDQFYQRLAEAGISADHEPKMIRGGYSLYFRALGGILFEVTCYHVKN